MADTKVSSLTAASALAGTELFYADDGAADVKVTATQVKTWTSASPTLVTPVIGAATGTSLNLATGASNLTVAPATANTEPLTITMGTMTLNTKGINITGTWNAAGVTFDAPLFMNMTNTASAVGTLLADFQVGGNSQIVLAKDGYATNQPSIYKPSGAMGIGANNQALYIGVSSAGAAHFYIDQNGFAMRSGGVFQWTSSSSDAGGSGQTKMSSPAAATFQFGQSDNATPVAQALRIQSVVAGTAAANGVNFTVRGSLSTGTGTSGDIIFQTGLAPGSGTTQATATTALTIKGETQAVVAAGTFSATIANVATTSAVCYNTGTGLFTYDGTIGTCTVSAARFKEGFEPIADATALEMVMAMQPKSWNYKWEPGRNRIGLVADDLLAIDPRLVGFGEDGEVANDNYWAVITLLAGAVKKQQTEIGDLRARLAA